MSTKFVPNCIHWVWRNYRFYSMSIVTYLKDPLYRLNANIADSATNRLFEPVEVSRWLKNNLFSNWMLIPRAWMPLTAAISYAIRKCSQKFPIISRINMSPDLVYLQRPYSVLHSRFLITKIHHRAPTQMTLDIIQYNALVLCHTTGLVKVDTSSEEPSYRHRCEVKTIMTSGT